MYNQSAKPLKSSTNVTYKYKKKKLTVTDFSHFSKF